MSEKAVSGLESKAREALVAAIARAHPELWRKVQKPYAAAMKEFERTGYVVNADILYPALTTVATSVLRPNDRTLFVLNCTALSATITPDKLRREIGPAMKGAAERLQAALARSATG